MLPVNGLLGDAETLGDVLPRPTSLTGRGNLFGLELLGQSAQTGDGPQTGIKVGPPHCIFEFRDGDHAVSIC
jgi:hypothetical protein